MPVKTFTTSADPKSQDFLLVTIANLLHAAGVTMAISPRGAEVITKVAMIWMDGQHERAVVEAEQAARELREMRSSPRSRVTPATPTATPEIRRQGSMEQDEPAAAPFPEDPASNPGGGLHLFHVMISAHVNAHIHTRDWAEAIRHAAHSLPDHITEIKVIKQNDLF